MVTCLPLDQAAHVAFGPAIAEAITSRAVPSMTASAPEAPVLTPRILIWCLPSGRISGEPHLGAAFGAEMVTGIVCVITPANHPTHRQRA